MAELTMEQKIQEKWRMVEQEMLKACEKNGWTFTRMISASVAVAYTRDDKRVYLEYIGKEDGIDYYMRGGSM